MGKEKEDYIVEKVEPETDEYLSNLDFDVYPLEASKNKESGKPKSNDDTVIVKEVEDDDDNDEGEDIIENDSDANDETEEPGDITNRVIQKHKRKQRELAELLFKRSVEGRTCKICDRVFARGEYLKDHMLIHTTDRPFICEECGQAFKSTKQLKAHQNSKPKWIHCDICPVKFMTKMELSDHKWLHNYIDVLTISTAVTDRSETSKPITDSGDPDAKKRNFNDNNCFVCLEELKSFCQIKQHLMRHKLKREYRCKKCGRIDKCQSNMKKHVLKVHMIGERKKEEANAKRAIRKTCTKCGHSFEGEEKFKVRSNLNI